MPHPPGQTEYELGLGLEGQVQPEEKTHSGTKRPDNSNTNGDPNTGAGSAPCQPHGPSSSESAPEAPRSIGGNSSRRADCGISSSGASSRTPDTRMLMATAQRAAATTPAHTQLGASVAHTCTATTSSLASSHMTPKV
mmetsp:Transcript_77874/g.220766  ORF Transcript_77874/g.220766 Transcript_77874/m.220766 type:complete len:138 (+) Transcript_77874:91-504(+)